MLNASLISSAFALALSAAAGSASAQPADVHSEHTATPATPGAASAADEHAGHAAPVPTAADHAGHQTPSSTPAQAHATHGEAAAVHDSHAMTGLLGAYPISREASGTSWQPELSPHHGIHGRAGGFDLMGHANLFAVTTHQGGRRGDEKTFVAGMLMGRASRPFAGGTLSFRGMLSPDPLMGRRGYPLLLATGETADGREPLIDRQHPHELFVELAASYNRPIAPGASLFLYGGPVAEPAFGPTTFMHRGSGLENPEAPITHHWFDSTHITFGVVTAGVTAGPFKVEGSRFRGREPDEDRYDIETPRLDSTALRLTWNPSPAWSLQASAAWLESPETLEPDVDDRRISLSVAHVRPVFGRGLWSTTLAYGSKDKTPGPALDAWLAETSVRIDDRWTFFARGEAVEQDELTGHGHGHAGHHAAAIYDVGKVSLGVVRDFQIAPRVTLGVGGSVSAFAIPRALEPEYGSPTGALGFLRLKIE